MSKPGAWLALALFGASLPRVAEAEEPREVPEALLPILEAAEGALARGRPNEALEALARYEGPPDALHALMLGHAELEAGAPGRAEAEYHRALGMDRDLGAAKKGLARAFVEQKKWREASELLARLVDVDTAPKAELGMYARVAYELGDHRLAALLVERGIVRFPEDDGLRRLDLAILVERGAHGEADDAARALLARHPEDGLLWRQLAAVRERSSEGVLGLAALEAAVLANPSDRALLRRHALAQLGAGHHAEALAAAKRILGERGDPDTGAVELGARIAEAAGELELAKAWLARVPPERRSEALHLLEARIALRAADRPSAERALDRLVASGDASPAVYLWAAQLAEEKGDMPRAEALYHEASDLGGAEGRLALLHLARLLHRIQQPDRASQLLSTYLAEHPDDAPARTLLAVIRQDAPAHN